MDKQGNQKYEARRMPQENNRDDISLDSLDKQEKSTKPLLGMYTIVLNEPKDLIRSFSYIIINQQEKRIQKVISFSNEYQKLHLNSFLKNSMHSICHYIRTHLTCIPIPVLLNNASVSYFLKLFSNDLLSPYKILVKNCIQLIIYLPKPLFYESRMLVFPKNTTDIDEQFYFYSQVILLMNQENIFFTDSYKRKGNNAPEVEKLIIRTRQQLEIIYKNTLKPKPQQEEQQLKQTSSQQYQRKEEANAYFEISAANNSIPNQQSTQSQNIHKNPFFRNKDINDLIPSHISDEIIQKQQSESKNYDLINQQNKSENQIDLNLSFTDFYQKASFIFKDKQINEKIDFETNQQKQKKIFEDLINKLIGDFQKNQEQENNKFQSTQQKEKADFDANLSETFMKIKFVQDALNKK